MCISYSHCVSTPRQVPLHFQGMVEKVIEDIVRSKVITGAEGPSEWCSPAFFVQNPMGRGLD